MEFLPYCQQEYLPGMAPSGYAKAPLQFPAILAPYPSHAGW
ncbi:hypothetical protein EVA_11599 [gut metagenome]|uniref:Uncharacterized protein n=1 Tax=gut metagenome TaxID=749906 RepID=J9G0D1_9ZZZZ